MPPHDRDDRTDLERFLDAVDDIVLYRYPHIAGPLFLAGLAYGLAYSAFRLGGVWPTLLTILACVVVSLGWASVREQPEGTERAYAATCWLSAGAWTIAAAWWGPTTGALPFVAVPWLTAAFLVILAVLMPPWVKHRRIRRGVEIAREIDAWDGDAVSLPFTYLAKSGAKGDADEWEAPLVSRIKGKYTLEMLRAKIPNIAARYDVEVSGVSIDKAVGDKEGRYRLRIRRTPRPVGGDLYVIPEKRPSASEPFRIGKLNGDPTQPLLSEIHRPGHGGVDGVTAGAKGHGKTNYFKRLAVQAIVSHDSLLFVGDMKPGSPDYRFIDQDDPRPGIGPRGAYVYATTYADIDLMVRALFILCDVRGAHPRKDRKKILALFDETALYFAAEIPTASGTTPEGRREKAEVNERNAARVSMFSQLVMVCRSADISIRAAVQKGKEKNLGGDARSQMLAGEVCGFFSAKESDSALLSGMHDFNLSRLARGAKGDCLLSNMIHSEVIRGQQDYVSPELVQEVLDRFGADQGDLFPDEIEALERGLGQAWVDLRGITGGPIVIDAEPSEPLPPADEDGPQHRTAPDLAAQTRERVYAVLCEMGEGQTGAIAREARKSPTIVRRRLNELLREGRVTCEGENRETVWRPVRVAAPTGS